MRLRDVIILSVCIFVAVVLFVISGSSLDYINSQRQKMQLVSNEPLKNAPPSLAFATVAMGAFRGLVVDILWIRADKLKEQGQFFDAKQLAEWITTLQPRFSAVWVFHAWNMAYNISVTIPATQPDQRWQWVKNGYELLRDQGIPLNPKSLELYRELARIFQHKIGDVADDAHKYYKLQLALSMEPLLGPADNQYFEALAKAPAQWQQIVSDANVAQLISALKSADKAFSDDNQFVSNYLSLRQNPARFNPNAFAVIDGFRGTSGLEKFGVFAKAYQLRNVWKLDPSLMLELNKTYGPVDFTDPNKRFPLDWRHSDSHAIYWGVKGLQEVSKKESRTIDFVETNTDRIVAHSLQNLFRNGKIFIYDVPIEISNETSEQPMQTVVKEIFLRPDLRMFEPYNRSVLAILDKYKDYERRGSYESLQDGHRNMLKNALFMFYQTGHIGQAQKIFDMLRQMYPRPEFQGSLVNYARKRWIEELDSVSPNDAKEQVIALMRESYLRYALRDDDEAFGREKIAKEIWDLYLSEKDDVARLSIPEFSLLRYLALIDFLNDQQYPLNLRRNLLNRIQIERPDLYKKLEQEEKRLIGESTQSP